MYYNPKKPSERTKPINTLMINTIILWTAAVLLSFAGFAAKFFYNPARRAADLFLTLFLFLTLATQLAAIYQTAARSAAIAGISVAIFLHYWSYFAPFYPNSDAAGNAMSNGFRSFFIFLASLLWGVISFLLIKLTDQTGIYIVLAIEAIVGLSNIYANRKAYISGDGLEERAGSAKMRVEDYRKTLFRQSMVEKGDAWEAKELDAIPKELEHWDVYGSNAIKVTSKHPVSFLEGDIDYGSGKVSIDKTGHDTGCLGKTYGEYEDGYVTLIPKHINLVWQDRETGKKYRIESDLPNELNQLSADKDRFRFDDLEFRLTKGGGVLIYRNRPNRIHNIKIDYPMGKTEEREKRFKYTIDFRSDNFRITKTICNFQNGEKILSGGKWEEDTAPARIKDVFLRFEDAHRRYACFLYFNEEEINKAFEEETQGVLSITVGNTKNDFEFTFNGTKIQKTEIRLYRVNEDEKGKLLFKNYKRRYTNRSDVL